MWAQFLAAAAVLTLVRPSMALAQLDAANEGPVVYGHHHVNATDLDAHRRFWVDALGGVETRLEGSPSVVIRFPNVLVFLRQQAPGAGTKGSTVNHVGFQVPDVRALVDRLRASGHRIVTKEEIPPNLEEKNGLAYVADQGNYIAFVMGPDETKVELFENRAMRGPIALHHIHFFTPDVEAMRAWYVKTFGATPGTRGSFQAADLPGVNLTFSPAQDPVSGTRGRALDHIGFEVDGLEAFVARLEAQGVTLDRPFTRLPASPLSLAFLTDPWGTYIELTEGLDAIR
jgi:catechol 2,3-dioxygenase-like lactoylglutathione lyase family enzyme